jgi:hypothetical protein
VKVSIAKVALTVCPLALTFVKTTVELVPIDSPSLFTSTMW